jgi:predicted transposase YdaD
MFETDMISDLLTAERRGKIQGRAEGIAEGEAKGKAEGEANIIALLESGLSLEEIKKRVAQAQAK